MHVHQDTHTHTHTHTHIHTHSTNNIHTVSFQNFSPLDPSVLCQFFNFFFIAMKSVENDFIFLSNRPRKKLKEY